MIGRLRGFLISKQAPWLVLDVNGVGYELEASMSTIYELPELKKEVSLFIHYAIKDDTVALYGFSNEAERGLFRSLLKVSGVGAKTALAVLSGVSVDDFSRLVHNADIDSLTRVPGIGKKTAERIVLELKDRLQALPASLTQGAGSARSTDPVSEASIALAQLGYKPVEVQRLIKIAAADGDSAEDIIRKALKAALK